jgi:hypothetical protein
MYYFFKYVRYTGLLQLYASTTHSLTPFFITWANFNLLTHVVRLFEVLAIIYCNIYKKIKHIQGEE